jgi:hypothetical protein
MVSSNARFFGTAQKKAARRCNGKILVYYIPIGKAVLETFACASRCIHRKSSTKKMTPEGGAIWQPGISSGG